MLESMLGLSIVGPALLEEVDAPPPDEKETLSAGADTGIVPEGTLLTGAETGAGTGTGTIGPETVLGAGENIDTSDPENMPGTGKLDPRPGASDMTVSDPEGWWPDERPTGWETERDACIGAEPVERYCIGLDGADTIGPAIAPGPDPGPGKEVVLAGADMGILLASPDPH